MSKQYKRNQTYKLQVASKIAWKSLYNGILLYKKYLSHKKNMNKSSTEYLLDIKSIQNIITSNWTKHIKRKSKQARILKEIISLLTNNLTTSTNDVLVNSETACLKKLRC